MCMSFMKNPDDAPFCRRYHLGANFAPAQFLSDAHCFCHSYKLLSEQKHFQTDAVNPGSGVTKSGRRKSVATTRWSLPCSGWATVITVIASMDCPAKLPPALLRNHCRNRSVSLKYSVDTPQHKDFFFFLQPFIQSRLILREKEIIVSIVAYISYIFKYQTQF